MSLNRAPQEALDAARDYCKKSTFNRVWTHAAQDASDRIWTAAPWRWSISAVTPVTVTAGSQQFEITVPADFERFEKCELYTVVGVRPVIPVSHIPTTSLVGEARLCAYVPGTPDYVRFDTTLPTLSGTTTFRAWCKLSAPALLSTLPVPGALVMPDQYFNVFQEFVLYYSYRYGDDQRAGSAQINVNAQNDRSVVYTGQLGVAMAALEEMRMHEPLLMEWPETQDQGRKER